MKILIVFLVLVMTGCCPFSVKYSDTTHIVKPGETLEEIAVQYYGSELQMKIILEANFLNEKGKRLKEGQKIIIPCR